MKDHISNTRNNSKQNSNFLKAHNQFPLKQHCFLCNLPTWIYVSGPVWLPVTSRAQRVNNEPWSCSFCLFLLEINSNYNQTAIFYLWLKEMPAVNPSNLGILSKIDIKKLPKKTQLKTVISQTWWARKKFKFVLFCLFHLEMSWNFLQTVIFHLWAEARPFHKPFSLGRKK